MKLHFEIEFDAHVDDESIPTMWNLAFTYDYAEDEITFGTITGQTDMPGDRYEDMEWLDFLKLLNRSADGDFVNNVYKLCRAHLDLNLDEALHDYHEQD